MNEIPKKKAKRILKDFNFETEGSALALVGPVVGGAANQFPTLIMKSTANFSEDFIKKASTVRVTMEITDFLEKFYGIYDKDAKVLAYLMGYDPSEVEDGSVYNDDYFWEWYEKTYPDRRYADPVESDYQEYIQSKLEGIEVFKSLKESDSIADVLCTLSEDQYMGMLRDQERVEKALVNVESVTADQIVTRKSVEVQPIVAEEKKVKARIVKEATTALEEGHKQADLSDKDSVSFNTAGKAEHKTEVYKMTKPAVQVEKTETVDMVEKSQYEIIEKALDDQAVELQKALDALAVYKEAEAQRVTKARKDTLTELVADEAKTEVLFKALGELDEEGFTEVVEVLKGLVAQEAAEDEMFEEQGAKGKEVEVVTTKSLLAANIKAKYSK